MREYSKSKKKKEFTFSGPNYMIDSSYKNASDPNTMMDRGPNRNAQYKTSVNAQSYGNLMNSRRSIDQQKTLENFCRSGMKLQDSASLSPLR